MDFDTIGRNELIGRLMLGGNVLIAIDRQIDRKIDR